MFSMKRLMRAFRDNRAKTEAVGIVVLAISVFIGASILPTALTMIGDVNQTGWSESAITMWGLVSIFVVLAFVVGIIAGALKSLGKL